MTMLGSFGAVLAAVGLVMTLPAQRESFTRALATGDAVAVEAARRRLIVGAADRVPVDALTQLLRSAEPMRRRSAASVLLHHGLGAQALSAWYDDERDARALEPLVDVLPLDILQRLVETELPANAGGDDADFGIDHATRLRARALGRLLDADRLDLETWRVALASADRGFARSAARLLVEEAYPLPLDLFDPTAPPALRRTLLRALADRPRPDAVDALDLWRQDAELDSSERLLVTLATPSAAWSRDAVRSLLGELAAVDTELRSLAIMACSLLSTEQAERLVADVHRRGMEGAAIDDLLPALAQVGPRGERHLVGLARELSDRHRAAIVEWLSARRSPVLGEIVGDALDGRYPLTPDLLMRSGELLGTPARVARVLSILEDDEGSTAMRVAAYDALVGRGVLEPAMLEFALDPDGDPRSRVRMLVSMPPDAIDPLNWGRILDESPHDAVREVLARMAEAPVSVALEERLLALIATGVGLADTAAHVCLSAGRAALAERVWAGLSDVRRANLAMSVRKRGGEPWVVPALRELAATVDSDELRFARVVAGDRAALQSLFDAPAAWSATWLRRVQDEARDALEAKDVPVVQRAFATPGLDAGRRRQLVRWIAERPDLGAGEWLARIAADDLDEEVRYAATRGLLRRVEIAREIRKQLTAAMPTGLDLDQRDVAFEALGALETPLDEDACVFAARFALVAPLAYREHELKASLRLEPVADVALLNAVWQVAGREPTPHLDAALRRAATEAASHPDFACAARQRLGRFLALLAREDATRRQSTAIARMILSVPDLDPGFVGPACVVLAEAAEREQDWDTAAELWRRAARGCLRTPPERLLLRSFVGDTWHAGQRLPAAFLTARPHLCAARAALAQEAVEDARAALAVARTLGTGDRQTVSEIEQLEQEIRR